jgi:hypothetical protein
MRRVLIVLAVLGSGTALSFLAAGAIFLANPEGHLVENQGFSSGIDRGGGVLLPPDKGIPVPMPVPAPAGGEKGVIVDDGLTIAPPPDAVVSVPAGAMIDPAPAPANVLPPQSGTQP